MNIAQETYKNSSETILELLRGKIEERGGDHYR